MRAMHGWVEAVVDDLLDAMEAREGSVDFVEAFAWNLPLRILTGILGVSEAESSMFRGWIDAGGAVQD